MVGRYRKLGTGNMKEERESKNGGKDGRDRGGKGCCIEGREEGNVEGESDGREGGF